MANTDDLLKTHQALTHLAYAFETVRHIMGGELPGDLEFMDDLISAKRSHLADQARGERFQFKQSGGFVFPVLEKVRAEA